MKLGACLLIVLVTAAVMTGCASAGGSPAAKYAVITTKDLQAKLDAREQLTIVDLREPRLYQAGHIPGAQNIPFEEFERRMGELRPDATIVLACHSGPMGDASGALLAERGYAKVSNLKGGMAAWDGKLEK